MSTGSKAGDEAIARLVDGAPQFSDERFALIKGLMQNAHAAVQLASDLNIEPELAVQSDRRAA